MGYGLDLFNNSKKVRKKLLKFNEIFKSGLIMTQQENK